MKFWISVLLTLLICGAAFAQEHSATPPSKPATLMTGVGNVHHPVSTNNPKRNSFSIRGCV